MENNTNVSEDISIEVIDISALEAQDRALIDRQIATAKQYPRNLHKVKDNIIVIASMDKDTAISCGYSLPRGGQNISGPSVHLARIVVQQYGNIRVDAKITDIGAKHVTGQSTCIDLENNVGIRVEVKKKITDKNGKRYNDDIITTTGAAAAATALRNSVFAVVPKPLIDAGYKAAQQTIIGDISDETKLLAKRKAAIDYFLKEHGVSEKDVLTALGLRETTQIKGEHLVLLAGMRQAIIDGDSTVDEMFYPEKAKAAANDPQITLDELRALFDEKLDKLTEEEQSHAERILKNNETNSFNKLYQLLISK